MIAIVINPDGTADPIQLGGVEIRFDRSVFCGWLAAAFVGRDMIAKAWAAVPDDAMRMVMERLAEVRDTIDLALCECGAARGEHECDPATVRMDTPDMMPEEP